MRDLRHALTIDRGRPVKLTGETDIWLSVVQHYRIVEYVGSRGPWKVSTIAYNYSLGDADDHEIIAYHWHPTQGAIVTFPHIHLGAGAQVAREEFSKAHLPTGRIALEDMIRLAIRDFRVAPRRDDWEEVLDGTQDKYNAWRTWS